MLGAERYVYKSSEVRESALWIKEFNCHVFTDLVGDFVQGFLLTTALTEMGLSLSQVWMS